MNKSWMTKNKWSEKYVRGVNEFLEFAFNNGAINGTIRCPCTRCANGTSWVRGMVYAHLINYGICQGYTCWYAHGEQLGAISSQATNTPIHWEPIHDSSSGMRDMLHEVFPTHDLEQDPGLSQCPISEMGDETEGVYEDRQGASEGTQKFYNFLNDANKPLYEGCTEYTKFSAILLEILNKMLPSDASLPKNTYEVKKYMRKLGLGYEKIPVCVNGCMLFWKDNENAENCKVCGKSKWNQNKDGVESSQKLKRKPKKVLRWFPLKSRLQRLFMSSKTALHMKWHAEKRTDDGILRHLADALAWKAFDSKYPDFASDSRNVRLGLATDGFNPFGNMSTSYSRKSPSFKIDVYLEPLISELKELWDVGEPTYDVSSNQTFTIHAALMWTINDFPAYGDVSGWSTKGRFACPCCMGGWRKEARSFDGTQELDHPPPMPTGDEIWRQVQGIDSVIEAIRKRPNIVQVDCDKQLIWKKQNNLKARLDLKKMGLRPELHPVPKAANKTYLPAACFTMTKKEKKDFLKVIQNVKVPDGYASNVSRCAKVEECSLVGLKSHDSHILMQQLMPIALRGSLTKKVVEPLIALSGFFKEICSKTLRLEDLDRLES
ncbi:uncharacterized protein LOC133879844 [Alnus glutinosa]|uniref:uncharacterized protein LOC133879844 n=1 Tax=Alnus glutinosa TaxID=3517 RepID=UPI002D7710D4|nr:uncharacterized protein LOC133879844 [Alnus glutinosa]